MKKNLRLTNLALSLGTVKTMIMADGDFPEELFYKAAWQIVGLRGNLNRDPLTKEELKKLKPLVPLTESAEGSKNLMKIFMPSMQTAEEITKIYPDIPAVILSGWMDEMRNFFGPSDKTKRGGHPHTQLSSWNDFNRFLVEFPQEVQKTIEKVHNA